MSALFSFRGFFFCFSSQYYTYFEKSSVTCLYKFWCSGLLFLFHHVLLFGALMQCTRKMSTTKLKTIRQCAPTKRQAKRLYDTPKSPCTKTVSTHSASTKTRQEMDEKEDTEN